MTTETAAPKIELWPVEMVKPHPRNAKLHPADQIETLSKAILRFGWDQPIVVDVEGYIIKGHGRRLAALKLVADGHDRFKRVPVICRTDMTAEEADAARLSDNRVVSDSYDTELLKEELRRLSELEIDLDGLGFTNKELEFLSVDLGEFDVSRLVDDIAEAVEGQREGNAAKIKEIDAGKVSLNEAFGFKSVTPEQSRKIKRFMATIESRTGKEGIDALDVFLDRFQQKAA